MTTDIETAGAILGIGRTKAYELAKVGEFPVTVLRIGRRYIVPIPALMTLLEVSSNSPRPDSRPQPELVTPVEPPKQPK
jgi:hypothetical protein